MRWDGEGQVILSLPRRVAFRLVLDSMILALQVRAVAYGIAAYLVGLEIRVKDRLWPGGW